MALLNVDFFAETLGLNTSMTVILPQPTSGQIGMTGRTGAGPPPVLYLLHGLSDDHTTWVRRTSIERYVAELGLAVIMPQVHRSFYTDEHYGRPYWTFLTEELPAVADRFFKLSDRRFVAGLSMGGYGALKWALREPGRFAAAASLSGALDLARRRTGRPRAEDPRMMERILGDAPVEGTGNDLFHLLDVVEHAPPLYLGCGTEDELYPESVRFRERCEQRGIAVTASFTPGVHEWAYWDATIQDVLAWLPIS
jgi:putative tributyrin esterase